MDDILKKSFRGTEFFFYKTPGVEPVIEEVFSDNYRIFERSFEFCPGDVVLDLGANEGAFSILLAKMFPYIEVIALEPVPSTFFRMQRNIGLNGVTNVTPYNVGVGGKNEAIDFVVPKIVSGGATSLCDFNDLVHELESGYIMTLDSFFEKYKIQKVKLLKIDIEGMEYEALYGTKVLDKVENVVAEFHINQRLRDQHRDVEALATFVGSKTNLLFYEDCAMADMTGPFQVENLIDDISSSIGRMTFLDEVSKGKENGTTIEWKGVSYQFQKDKLIEYLYRRY